MCLQLSTIATAVAVTIHRHIGLCYARHFRHHVRCTPRRAALVGIWSIARYSLRGTNLIKCLGIAADNARLFYVACHPLVEVTVFEQHKLAVGLSMRRHCMQSQQTDKRNKKSFLSHLHFILIKCKDSKLIYIKKVFACNLC